ncbi:MAG: hypothetical protein K2L10_11840 [Ruminococcus sp.]|nr:hypothetical protein [Ruminococcus sp.]
MPFCPKCGKPLPDGALCDCQDTNIFDDNQLPQKKEKKKFVVIGSVAVVAVTAVVLLTSSLGGGYKKPINDLVNSINKGDSAKMFSAVIPKDKIKEMKKELKGSKFDWDDLMDTIDDGLEDSMEDLEYKYGKNVKLSVKFLEKKKVKGDDLEEIEELYEDTFDAEVSKAYKVKVEMTIKGKKEKDTNKSWLYVAKIKGDDWKVTTYKDETNITDMLGSFF